MNVLIITSAKFPNGDAEALRLYTIGNLLRDLEHTVFFISMGSSQYGKELTFEGFHYVSLSKKPNNKSMQKNYRRMTWI